ncbi:MAG: hypothetical protein D6794_09730 [Deltaproteobacteria bacterium]|nr:MAG: hypothetical protein D6794_09730 [Deltaproteobacteria bacterium]
MKPAKALVYLAFFLSLFLTACRSGYPNKPDTTFFTFDGRVVFVGIEGGFFGLVDDQGNRFLPDRLPADLMRTNLPVHVRARFLPPAPGFRMWGRRIHIEEIAPR